MCADTLGCARRWETGATHVTPGTTDDILARLRTAAQTGDAGILDETALEQALIPKMARDPEACALVEQAARRSATDHRLVCADARTLSGLPDGSAHLVLTSPPYWTLKQYNRVEGQLGEIDEFESFVGALDDVWRECFRVLVPGGRVVCVVGDVLLSRRQNGGRHTVVPLHASIQEHCRALGFDNLAPIIWNKIGNAQYEVGRGGFLGKPYEPNAVIKNDIEYILFQRKPGGYRNPSPGARLLSLIPAERHQKWFQQVWTGIGGASTREHPAPFPLALAERLVRMFSFVGDVVLDPFMGTGTTAVAALRWGRSSVGVEVDPQYAAMAHARLDHESRDLFANAHVDPVTIGFQ